jgi:hypothetical protein
MILRQLTFRLIVLLFILAASSPSNAQHTPAELNIGRMFDHYATISGGWYLNVRCNVLSKEDKLELTWQIERIDLVMQGKADAAFLRHLRNAGEMTAASPTFASCDADAQRIVQEVLMLARAFCLELTGETYAPGKPLLATWETRYALAWMGMQIEKKCPRLPASLMNEVNGVFDALRLRLQQSPDAPAVAAIEARINRRLADDQKKLSLCTKETEEIVVNALGMIRQLEKEK